MPTLNQLVQKYKTRKTKIHKSKPTALNGCPQRKGVCTKITTMSPKKTKFCSSENCKS